MAFSKLHLYPIDEQRLCTYTKALGYPARTIIIRSLKANGKMCVQDLAKGHPINEESISDHLRILRTAQLIDFEIRFPYIFYYIVEDNLKEAQHYIAAFFGSILNDNYAPT